MSDTIRDVLRDILRHTHSLGIYEMAKIVGEDNTTLIESVDPSKLVILKGKIHNEVPEFANQTVGLSRMSVLDGYLKYEGFNDEGAKVSIVSQERNGESVPAEVAFTDVSGTDAHYRFMLADVINQQLQSVKFRGADFNVQIVPTNKNLKDLSYFNTVLGGFESNFYPKTENGELYFYVGDQGGDRTKIHIASGVEGEILKEWKWPLDIVLKILRLGNGGTVTLNINDQGLLKIVVDSGIGEYVYLIPVKS